VRPDLRITIVPGIGHIGMTVAPRVSTPCDNLS
jgi:hypothetical protein